MRAAYEQGKILLARRSISSVLQDPETPLDQREKLEVVLQARAFSEKLGLNPGGSFTKYSKVDRDPLAWVVVGSRRDSFSLRLWWFPIVGSVPYKGFFDKPEAEAEAANLEASGYETWVRGTEAFSTLGWFNDPVLSTTLKNPASRIVNTVIHESVHSTVWIKNNVTFNESFANFIGTEGALAFFQSQADTCAQSDDQCAKSRDFISASARDRILQYDLSSLIEWLYADLDKLYRDESLSSEQKIQRRAEIFDQLLAPFRERYPKITILKSINNAEIVQLKLYLTELLLFQQLFEKEGRNWSPFISRIREIQSAIDRDSSLDPFTLLKDMVKAPHE
jgi:predicted aminopeptidase